MLKHYSKEEARKRTINRTKLNGNDITEWGEKMREQSNDLNTYESNIIETTNQSTEESVSAIKVIIEKKSFYSRHDVIQKLSRRVSIINRKLFPICYMIEHDSSFSNSY